MERTEREKKREKGKEEKRRGTHKYVNNHALHIVSNSDRLITGTTVQPDNGAENSVIT